jgi:hypothetical protein
VPVVRPMSAGVRPATNVRRPRRLLSFHRLVTGVADRFGASAAVRWAQAVLKYQGEIDEMALRSALLAGDLNAVMAVVDPTRLRNAAERALREPFAGAVAATGHGAAALLSGQGLRASFRASHPNVVLYARTHAAALVEGVADETRRVIAEVIALGAERGLTTVQQSRAIREVVGLPPQWARAPQALADELRAGDLAAATRRLSATERQEVRGRILDDTVDDAFVDRMTARYAESLVNLRAQTIARTESLAAAHAGLVEEWKQARDAGVLPIAMRQYWIVTPDDRLCPICVRIPEMNPDGRALGEPFMTPEGLVDYPPAPHPNCRCGIGLALPGMGEAAEEEEAFA